MLKIGIDLDDCITYSLDFFVLLTHALYDKAEIHIITNHEQTPESRQATIQQLEELNIKYHHLKITGEKAAYIMEQGISIYFDDSDSYFHKLPESVTVFKIREPWNFDFDQHKWLYSHDTGRVR